MMTCTFNEKQKCRPLHIAYASSETFEPKLNYMITSSTVDCCNLDNIVEIDPTDSAKIQTTRNSVYLPFLSFCLSSPTAKTGGQIFTIYRLPQSTRIHPRMFLLRSPMTINTPRAAITPETMKKWRWLGKLEQQISKIEIALVSKQ